jgi:hypothetical protein
LQFVQDLAEHGELVTNYTVQIENALIFRHLEVESVSIIDYEGMLTYSDFVDGSVVVPGVPIVGVFPRSD